MYVSCGTSHPPLILFSFATVVGVVQHAEINVSLSPLISSYIFFRDQVWACFHLTPHSNNAIRSINAALSMSIKCASERGSLCSIYMDLFDRALTPKNYVDFLELDICS